jgi:small subunit ribosomal protein S8
MDPVANMLTQIRNAQAVGKKTVEVPYSDFTFEIASLLEKEKFLGKVEKKGRKEKKKIDIALKYKEEIPVISGIRKISKSGQRIYESCKDIKKVKGGYGIAVISTSKGILTDREAKKQKVGGEIICQVW